MPFSITDFKSRAIPRGGFRPTLFEIRVAGVQQELSFLARASQVPALSMGMIEVPYFGRKIKIAGDRTYAEWTTTIMAEEDFGVRSQLERWSMDINRGSTNIRTRFNEEYKEDAEVLLYGKAGDVIRRYRLVGCWPMEVGPIELDWETVDTIGEYEVTWAFDFMDEGA